MDLITNQLLYQLSYLGASVVYIGEAHSPRDRVRYEVRPNHSSFASFLSKPSTNHRLPL